MKISQSGHLIKRLGFFIPVTSYFILFSIVALIGYKTLLIKSTIPDSAFKDIFLILLSITLWFCVIIICLGFTSVLISFMYFKWKKSKNLLSLELITPHSSQEAGNSEQLIQIKLSPILKPFLGFIKIRLQYDSIHYSEKFSLLKSASFKVINTQLDGVYHWNLPQIREYRIENVIVYFEDFFQFFSLALGFKANSNFNTQPITQNLQNLNSSPRKTEETAIRIDELKRVEGELINYKNFESNDDVRRIVWKIYAKNKELVVRIPEIIDPYASHIYLYASFYSSFSVEGNSAVEISFLNYYKTICWSVYMQLVKKGLEVRYVPDQELPQKNFSNANEQIKYSITVSSWQTDKNLRDYVKQKDTSVLIISSLSDFDEVSEVLENLGNEISIVFVPLSQFFNKQNIADWLQWIFIQNEKNQTALHQTNWNLSTLRLKVIDNERKLKILVKKYDKSIVM